MPFLLFTTFWTFPLTAFFIFADEAINPPKPRLVVVGGKDVTR